jgi:hypothetical protein
LRLLAVRMALILSALLAAGVYCFSLTAAHGFLMGALAGILAFWIVAVQMEKVASTEGTNFRVASAKWALIRYALWGVALWQAFELDTVSRHGLFGAVAGLFVIRVTVVILAMTGMDLKREEN